MAELPGGVKGKGVGLWGWAFLALLVYGAFFHQLGRRGLCDPDEPRYARAAEEMLQTGRWSVPSFNGEDRLEKPVFFYWCVMASYAVFGVSELSARLASATAAALTVLVVVLFARRRFGARAAWYSGCMLATSLLFMAGARIVTTDLMLSFLWTSALLGLAMWWETGDRRWAFWGGVAAGLGFLTKGPVVLVNLVLIGVATAAVEKNWGRLKKAPWVMLTVLALAPALLWGLWVMRCYPDLLRYYFYEETLERFFTHKYRRDKPIGYIVAVLMAGVFPWSLVPLLRWPGFLRLRGLRAWVAQRRGKISQGSGTEDLASALDSGPVWLWMGLIVPVIFFSISESALATYVLPIVPPLCLIAGLVLAQREKDGMRALPAWFHWSVAGVASAMVIVAFVLMRGGSEHGAMIEPLTYGFVALSVPALAALKMKSGNRFRWGVVYLVAMAVFMGVARGPAEDHFGWDKSKKAILDGWRGLVPASVPVGQFDSMIANSAVFYLNHKIEEIDEEDDLQRWVVGKPEFYLITNGDPRAIDALDQLALPYVQVIHGERLVVFKVGGTSDSDQRKHE